MSSSKTPTTFAILGLLRLRSWTTYELAKQVQRSLNWFWPRAERKLYDEPKRLVLEGLATATAETTGRRPKTIYDITDQGQHALRAWLSEPSAARTAEFEAMIKVFFADAGSKDQLRSTLIDIQDEATQRIEHLARLTAGIATESTFPERLHINALTVRLQLEQELAIRRWSRWAQDAITSWVDTTDPGTWDVDAVLASVAEDSRLAAES